MKARFGRIWIQSRGFKPALVFQGRKRLSVVIQTPALVVVHLPLDSKVDEIDGWTVRGAAIRFRKQGRKFGQTKEARRLLRGV